METAASNQITWDISVGNRFAPHTPDNHSGPLWVAAILGMIYVVGVLILRVHIKRRMLGYDDYLITASSVFAICQYVMVYYALSSGLGQSISHVQDDFLLGRLVFSTRVLYFTSLCLAKLSVLAIVYRIFCRDNISLKFPCYVAMGGTAISGVASVLIVTIGCPTTTLFTGPHCLYQVVRWSIVTGLDILTEVATLLLLSYMVWQLHMPVRKKIQVIVAFSTRASVIVISVLSMVAWRSYADTTPSPLNFTEVMIWQQVLLAVSVMSATLPSLKAFLESLSARWGEADLTGYGSYGTRVEGLELNDMDHSHPKTSHRNVEGQVVMQSNAQFETRNGTWAREVGGRASRASTRGGSQDLIIKKETTWNVVRA